MIYNCCLVFCKFSLRMLRRRCLRLCCCCCWLVVCGATTIIFQSKNKGPVTHSACLPACRPGPASAAASPPPPLSHSISLPLPLRILLLFRNGDDAICVFCFCAVILHSEQCSEAAKLLSGERGERSRCKGCQLQRSLERAACAQCSARRCRSHIIHTCYHLRALAAVAATVRHSTVDSLNGPM